MEYRKWDKEAKKKETSFDHIIFFLKTQVAVHLYAFGLILFERRGTNVVWPFADEGEKSPNEKIRSSSSVRLLSFFVRRSARALRRNTLLRIRACFRSWWLYFVGALWSADREDQRFIFDAYSNKNFGKTDAQMTFHLILYFFRKEFFRLALLLFINFFKLSSSVQTFSFNFVILQLQYLKF